MTKDDLQKSIGNRIKEIRSLKGWSQSDLAREAEKDRQAIEKIENGKVNPTIFTLLEISKSLNVELHELLKFK